MKKIVSSILILILSLSLNSFTSLKHPESQFPKKLENVHYKAFQVPIQINIDITITFTVGGIPCTDHITGSVTLEFKTIQFVAIISQSLHHDIHCGNKKPIEGHLRSLAFNEESQLFIAAEFDTTGDDDIDKLTTTDDFQNQFLQEINSQLSFAD